MKVVTLNIGRDDYMETEVLFIIGDINNFNELEFLKRVKKRDSTTHWRLFFFKYYRGKNRITG